MRFEWDDQNIEHIARHGVSVATAEAVCTADGSVLRRLLPLRWDVHGEVHGLTYRVIVAAVGDNMFRVITAHRVRKERAK